MTDDPGELSKELKMLRKQLDQQFHEEQWNQMASTLDALAQVGQDQGQRELCLRAQSLRELMNDEGGGRNRAGAGVMDLFNQLMFHLSHLQWLSQTSH